MNHLKIARKQVNNDLLNLKEDTIVILKQSLACEKDQMYSTYNMCQ